MSKKVFTLLLLAVVVLAQFSIASAAPSPVILAGTATVTALPTFSSTTGNAKIDWSVTGMPGAAAQYINVWSRLQATPANPWSGCQVAGTANTFTSAVGSYNYALGGFNNQDVVEFYITVDDTAACGGAVPATSKAALASTFIDDYSPYAFQGNPPTLTTPATFDDDTVACNTFEMWGLASDSYSNVTPWGYSGFKSWQPLTTGTQAVPAPVSDAVSLLSWTQTLPATASGAWSFSVNPVDNAKNEWGAGYYFRNAVVIVPAELADCKSFTDTAGNANEVYVRYLATLGIGAGNADGSYGPDTTLTRAEAAALLEVANGMTAAGLPATPSAACTFTDVAATDWFAGWVWQACADGFLNGVGGGMFDPSNTLTRGQVVTIFNNIYNNGGGAAGGYFDWALNSVLRNEWNNWSGGGYPYLREAAWTDVSVGAYYALPVQRAYGVGVADGVTADTFAPDQAILRGEFAKMLYRALSAAN